MYANAAPASIPGNGAVPGIAGTAPIGYWIYQPANGYPITNQTGGLPCIPVFGPTVNGYTGYGPPPASGNPAAPSGMAAMPPSAAPGAQPDNGPSSGAAVAGDPQGMTAPPGFVSGRSTPPAAPALDSQGNAAPQSWPGNQGPSGATLAR
jgi:hypothetical protein